MKKYQRKPTHDYRHWLVVNMPYQFMSFLIANHALGAYIDNCVDVNNGIANLMYIRKTGGRLDFEGVIFSFITSPERFDYWYQLRMKYYKLYPNERSW